MTRRIAEAVGGPAGAVAAALVTGKRGLIDERTNEVLRAAGIYHIVSISGLHMVLAAGGVLLDRPGAPRRCPGVGPALAGEEDRGRDRHGRRDRLLRLLRLRGRDRALARDDAGDVRRRLVDRPALSLRNLAIAALIVLAREPETLLGPSFRCPSARSRPSSPSAPLLTRGPVERSAARPDLPRRSPLARRALVGLAATTCVARLATAPFSAYHFQTANPLGLLGNALALPLVGVVVMPVRPPRRLAYPFGLDRPVWSLMGAAVGAVLDVSAWVSGLRRRDRRRPGLRRRRAGLLRARRSSSSPC